MNILNSLHVQFLFLFVLLLLFGFASWKFLLPKLSRQLLKLADRCSGAIIVFLGILVLALGFLGFSGIDGHKPTTEQHVAFKDENGDCHCEVRETTSSESILAAIYETFQIFAFNVSAKDLQDSLFLRWAMLFAILLAITLASKGIAILFHDSYVALQLRRIENHTIVCGLGSIGRQLLTDLAVERNPAKIVVIDSDTENINLGWARDLGIFVVLGDATKSEVLERVGLHRAKEIFVVTGSDECNIESVIEIRDILKRKGRRKWFIWERQTLKCHVHVLDRELADIIRAKTINLERANGHFSKSPIDIEIFNALERTARRLLEDIATSKVNGQAICPIAEDEVSHFIMLGFGEFGQTLALKLAELSHFKNVSRIRLTILDRDILKIARPFISRYPAFGPEINQIKDWDFDATADDWQSKKYRPAISAQLANGSKGIEYVCNAQFIEYSDVTDHEFLTGLKKCATTKGVKPVILVCFEDDRKNFALAERLRHKFDVESRSWPIFVWIPKQRELSQLLSDQRESSESRSGPASEGTGGANQPTGTSQPTGNSQRTHGCELIPFGQCYGSASYDEVTQSWTDWLARLLHLVWIDDTETGWDPIVGEFQSALRSADPAKALSNLGQPTTFAVGSKRQRKRSKLQKSSESNGEQTKRQKKVTARAWAKLEESSKAIWEGCEEWKRASNRSAAIHSVLKAAVLQCRIVGNSNSTTQTITLDSLEKRKETLRQMEHYRWVSERLIAGWRYSTDRDDIKKTRWQITHWDGLDSPPKSAIDEARVKGKVLNEKKKDEIMVELVIALLKCGRLAVKEFGQGNSAARPSTATKKGKIK